MKEIERETDTKRERGGKEGEGRDREREGGKEGEGRERES